MDPNFLKFFEQVFRKSADKTSRLADMGNMIANGFKVGGEYFDIFRKIYGLEADHPNPKKDGMNPNLEKAMADVNAGIAELLSVMDVVRGSEHRDLLKKHEALKEKMKEQDLIIKSLRQILEGKEASGNAAVASFLKLVETQQAVFSKFMPGMGRPAGGKDGGPKK